MNIYIFNITVLRNRNIFESKLKDVDQSRRDRIEKYKVTADKLRCLGAGLLIKFIKQKYGINEEVITDKFGKPYFENSDIKFNISHSGMYVIAAVSKNDIGIDIQKIKSDKYRIAEKNFLSSECEYINAVEDDKVMQQRFCEVWTMKEAYLKNTGIGLRKPLNSFELDLSRSERKISDKEEYKFVQLMLDEKYVVAACINGNDEEFDIEEVLI